MRNFGVTCFGKVIQSNQVWSKGMVVGVGGIDWIVGGSLVLMGLKLKSKEDLRVEYLLSGVMESIWVCNGRLGREGRV